MAEFGIRSYTPAVFRTFRPSISKSRRRPAAWLLLAIVLPACMSGCVRRRMTIRSNPPGAVVYVSNHEIGTTPIAHDFTYYGTRDIRLVKDGYEPLIVQQPNPTPWYQIPPLDFFSEVLVPGEIRDHRTFDFNLVPQRVVPTEELLGRGEELRGRVQSTGFNPPASTPSYAPPPSLAPPQASGGMPMYSLPPDQLQ